MSRILIALILLSTPLMIAPGATPEREMREMPVMVLYCDEDPGTINVGGGKEPDPKQLVESDRCTPAEGVSLTFVLVNEDWDFETDDPEDNWHVDANSWFARCDMDVTGMCQLNSPVGFDIVLGVFLHDATVKPGYEPANFRLTTQNYTEFAGYGLAILPTGEPMGEIGDHQTVALHVTNNSEPTSVLTKWDIDANDNDAYLATNADGWVSTVADTDSIIELEVINLPADAQVTASCSANDDASVEVTVTPDSDDPREMELQIPTTDSDIRCDIQISN